FFFLAFLLSLQFSALVAQILHACVHLQFFLFLCHLWQFFVRCFSLFFVFCFFLQLFRFDSSAVSLLFLHLCAVFLFLHFSAVFRFLLVSAVVLLLHFCAFLLLHFVFVFLFLSALFLFLLLSFSLCYLLLISLSLFLSSFHRLRRQWRSGALLPYECHFSSIFLLLLL